MRDYFVEVEVPLQGHKASFVVDKKYFFIRIDKQTYKVPAFQVNGVGGDVVYIVDRYLQVIITCNYIKVMRFNTDMLAPDHECPFILADDDWSYGVYDTLLLIADNGQDISLAVDMAFKYRGDRLYEPKDDVVTVCLR